MKKLLIVDDASFIRRIHKQILNSMGYTTIEVATGTEALEFYEKEKPDAVIVDLIMPDIDGMEVAKKILGMNADAKIIICSADRQKHRKEEAEKMGVLGFLEKPIDPDKVIETVNKIFGEK